MIFHWVAIAAVANHLWQSTAVLAAVALLTAVLRGSRATVRCGLWLAASAKFCVPFAALVAVGRHFAWRISAPAASSALPVVIDAVSRPFSRPALAAIATGMSAPAPDRAAAFAIVIAAIWFAGCAAALLAGSIRWRRVRVTVHAATSMGSGREHQILRPLGAASLMLVSSDSPLEPGVFGILRPVLFWPRGISARLGDAQIEAILAHELAHIRRRDNLAALHALVQAVFWFHPLVWWVGARLVDERERACDEEVIRRGTEPDVYAESLLQTCRFCVESQLACVAGVTGSDLTKRIEAIMNHSAADTLNIWRRGLLATAAVAAIAAPIVVGALAAPVRAQTSGADAGAPAFEVASVKLNKSGDGRIGIGLQPGGRFNATNVTLKMLIGMAYGTPQPLPDSQLIGGPKWIDTDRFDVVAKAPEDSPSGPNVPSAQMYPMIRTLLAERFKLAVHHETRELPIYALMLARGDGRLGPQMKPAAVDCAPLRGARGSAPPPIPPAPGERLACGIRMSPGNLSGGGTTMAQLTTVLARFVDRVIVDRTALTGSFDVDLTWTPDRLPQGGPGLQGGPGGAPPAPPLSAIDPNGPSIFTAVQEQLGLKLESTKGPVDVVVIDSAEHPTED